MPHGIKVWRWSRKHQFWYPHGRMTSGEHRRPEESRGSYAPGRSEGDWLIEVEAGAANQVVRVPAHDVGNHGTIWYCNRNKEWLPVYKRSRGKTTPEFLAALNGKHGDVLIDTSNALDPDAQGHILLNPKGEREYPREEIRLEPIDDHAAPVDDHDWPGEIGAREPHEQIVMNAREARALEIAQLIDRLRARLNQDGGVLLQTLQDYAQVKSDDPRSQKVLLFLRQFIVDLAPAPTAGTLAPVDLTRFIDDLRTFDTETYNDGKPVGTAEGVISTDAAADLKTVGDLLAAGGALAEYLLQLKNLIDAQNIPAGPLGDKQFKGVVGEAAATAVLDVSKFIPNLLTGINNAMQLFQASTVAAQSLQAASTNVPFVSSAVGMLHFLRAARKARRANVRRREFHRILCEEGVRTMEMRGAIAYAIGKTFRKTGTQSATAAAAGAGGIGGLLAGLAAVGVIAASNPVGWVFLGIATVGGAGIVGYKIYRRVTRQKRYEQRIRACQPQTPGQFAELMLKIARDPRHEDQRVAVLMLESFGAKGDSIYDSQLDETVKGLFARHLK